MNWLRWMLAGWCCFTAWIPAHGQDAKTDPQPPRNPAVQRVLDDWIYASNQLGPYTAELIRYTYDETFLEMTVAELQLQAVNTESWRLSSSPSAPVIPEGTTHRANGRDFAVKHAKQFIQLRDHSTFWNSEDDRATRVNLFDEQLTALQHSENPPTDADLAALHFRSLWRFPQFPIVSIMDPHGMLAFPHLYQQTLEECEIQFGSMHESGDPTNVIHLKIFPASEAMRHEVERIEILIDPATSLLKAAQFVCPRGTRRQVYVVRSQRRMQAVEYRITPKTLWDLEQAGVKSIQVPVELQRGSLARRKK